TPQAIPDRGAHAPALRQGRPRNGPKLAADVLRLQFVRLGSALPRRGHPGADTGGIPAVFGILSTFEAIASGSRREFIVDHEPAGTGPSAVDPDRPPCFEVLDAFRGGEPYSAVGSLEIDAGADQAADD